MDRCGTEAAEGWPDWHVALGEAHAPEGPEDISRSAKARERLAFDELMAHQLTLALARQSRRRQKGFTSRGDGRLRQKVLDVAALFAHGRAARALSEIEADMAGDRMSRLLQGDVGAGKTLVALMALLIAVEAGGQGVMMAPTSILAGQHYANLKPLAEAAGVVIEILTGPTRGRSGAKLRRLRRATSRSWSALMRCSRRTSPSPICALPSSMNSTGSAWPSACG
jgi:ATP-dependent DNA helicase RecG